MLASTLMIIPRSFSSLQEGLICLAVAVAGFIAAHFLGVWGRRSSRRSDYTSCIDAGL